jgi:hypothetical protein
VTNNNTQQQTQHTITAGSHRDDRRVLAVRPVRKLVHGLRVRAPRIPIVRRNRVLCRIVQRAARVVFVRVRVRAAVDGTVRVVLCVRAGVLVRQDAVRCAVEAGGEVVAAL